jgi:hypothetical protein
MCMAGAGAALLAACAAAPRPEPRAEAAAAGAARGPSAPAPAPAVDLPQLEPLMRDLEEIRGMSFRKEVPAQAQAVADWTGQLRAQIEEMLPAARRQDMALGLWRLGLLREPVDLGAELLDAAASQAGAYYDPETDRFYYLMLDLPALALQVMAAHELQHALQDQYFDLEAALKPHEERMLAGQRNDDALLALRFLVEGEATYVMTLWQARAMMGIDLTANPLMEQTQIRMMAAMDAEDLVAMARSQMEMIGLGGEDGALAESLAGMERIPPYILHPLYEAYMRGAVLAMELRQQGGWEAVNAAFVNPPRSAEQALHPSKLTAPCDEPTPLALPQWVGMEGWTRIDQAVHGEFYLGLLLRQQGASREVVAQAAAGWDGDVYQAWRRGEEEICVVLATTWDTEDDAREFFEAYRSILPAKHPGLAGPPEPAAGACAYGCGPPAGARGRLVLRGREVFAVEGAPEEVVNSLVVQALAEPIAYAR